MPVSVIPSMKYFCAKKNMASTGSIMRVEAAITIPYSLLVIPSEQLQGIGQGHLSGYLYRSTDHKVVPRTHKCIFAIAASAGFISGSITLQNVVQ